MSDVLVVGANRGIGLGLCKQLVARGDRVVATTRKPSKELQAIDGVEVREGVDVTESTSIAELAASLEPSSLDILLMVAGIGKPTSLESFDADAVREQFEVNALGVIHATVILLPSLRDGGKIGLLTSRMGSIADNTSGGSYGYRMSKAALNIGGRSLAIDLRPRGIAVAILHPGWVKTDMTHGQGLIDPATSASGLLARMDELTLETSGEFVHENGESLPW